MPELTSDDCSRCKDQAARLSAAFYALAEARRGGASVVRIDEMHAVLAGLPAAGGQR